MTAAEEQFRDLVNQFIFDKTNNWEDLGRYVVVSFSTLARWAHGTARPHPTIQKQIVIWIRKRLLPL